MAVDGGDPSTVVLTLETGLAWMRFFSGTLNPKEGCGAMKRKRYSDEQIAFALRQAEGGTAVEEICRKLGVAEATFYR